MDAFTIATFAAEVERLQLELQQAKTRLLQARVAAAGVSVGDVVLGNDGKRYRIADIDPVWGDKAWIKGEPQRKDGTFGTATRNLFGAWQKVAS